MLLSTSYHSNALFKTIGVKESAWQHERKCAQDTAPFSFLKMIVSLSSGPVCEATISTPSRLCSVSAAVNYRYVFTLKMIDKPLYISDNHWHALRAGALSYILLAVKQSRVFWVLMLLEFTEKKKEKSIFLAQNKENLWGQIENKPKAHDLKTESICLARKQSTLEFTFRLNVFCLY